MTTPQEIREWIEYDPKTGDFKWKRARGNLRAGASAGHWQAFPRGYFYRVIRFAGRMYPAAHIAFAIMTGSWPTAIVDHRNGDTRDNKWRNLRQANRNQNGQNKRTPTHNKSGAKGVSWDKWASRWVARIRQPGGAYLNLGRYDSVAEAKTAYEAASARLFGEFARAA